MGIVRSNVKPLFQLPGYLIIPWDDARIRKGRTEEGSDDDPFQDDLHTTTEGICRMLKLWRECPRQHKIRVVGTWDHQHHHCAANIGPLPRCKAAATAYGRLALILLASQVPCEALLGSQDAHRTKWSWRIP